MKKPTILKIALLLFVLLQADIASSQVYKTFSREKQMQLKGDIITIGNNILNRRETNSRGVVIKTPNDPYTDNGFNGNFDMYYVNIDNGRTPGIFSSSSAKLTIPSKSAQPCYRVAYAALYWSGILKSPATRTNINKVKLKVPDATAYVDITGTLIHDITRSADGINPDNTQAYACFADITNFLNASSPNGEYTVANVIATEGPTRTNGATGLAAGWSIFIIYEDSTLPTKAISSFNGFAAMGSNDNPLTTTISGFTAIDKGPVTGRLAFAALEGDRGYTQDYLDINGTRMTPNSRPKSGRNDNFFTSTIDYLGVPFVDRNPASTNTLGFDSGVLEIGDGILKNGDTSARITLGTGSDVYIYYFTAFSIDIIAPKIVLKKGVYNIANEDASGKDVKLGDQLTYSLKFKNEGNDNATSFTIIDKLPDNTDFVFPTDLIKMPGTLPIPTTAAGNQYVKYDTATRTLTFTIPNSYVTFKPVTAEEEIKFRVTVVNDCEKLTNACSNLIQNTAESHYFGDLGGNTTDFGDKSYANTAGCNLIPQSTNFLVGIEDCRKRSVYMCTTSREISASGGYASYSWSKNLSGTPVIGTNQKLTVTEPGTYYVHNTANAPCPNLVEEIEVLGGAARVNPVLEYADNKDANGNVPLCQIDGKALPKIYLCGTDSFKLIDTHITGATIRWQKTDCVKPDTFSDLCAYDDAALCQWREIATGSIYKADTAGSYRVIINAGGCENTYYFNVYKSIVSATIAKTDKVCYGKGTITVQKLDNYQYKLINLSKNNEETQYQDSNTFDVWEEGTYVAVYRLKNVTGTCEYKTAQVTVEHLLMNTKIENKDAQPFCFGSNGSIIASASAGFTNYYFELRNGANQVLETVGPVTDRIKEFSVAPGDNYTVEIYTKDANGNKICAAADNKYIQNPSSAIIPAVSTVLPLTACSDGMYRVTATGGKQGNYAYFVDGSATAQAHSENDNTVENSILIVATAPKTYKITVRDQNNCEKTIEFTVPSAPKPVYTVVPTSSKCYDGSSSIKVDVTNPNGYKLAYSINNGLSYQDNPNFLNLEPGNYKVIVKYSIDYAIPQWPYKATKDCFTDAEEVNITGPTSALTASAGVAALAGCTDPDGDGVKEGGIIRFNNVEGGEEPYEFSFKNGEPNSWGTVREIAAAPGDYQLVVRDKNLCTFTIPYTVTLDAIPANPIINKVDTVYACDGIATSTVTVTTPAQSGETSYSYEYYMDTKPNVPITSNVFTGVKSGDHEVIVKYKATQVPTYSNLLIEDFGKGSYTTTPGINPGYCFEDETSTHLAPDYKCNRDEWINDGEYAVASSIRTRFDNSWIVAKDHTVPQHPLGRFLCVNVGGTAGIGGILYSKPITDVIPNQPVIISLWAENLIVKTSTSHADPKLTIQLINNLNGVGGTETIVATTDTNNPWVVPKTEQWEYKELSLDPKAFNNLSFVIRSYSNEFNGNDVLIDDIWVRQIPESCGGETKINVIVESGKGFDVSEPEINNVTCNGGDTGSIIYQVKNFTGNYEYKVNNGNWIPSSSATLTLDKLTVGNYKIIIRSDSTGACSESFDIDITAPVAVTSVAAVTLQPTCLRGATIRATGGGGTPGYTYELRQGTNVIIPYQANRDFNKLPNGNNIPEGTYRVYVKDSGGCESAASNPVEVKNPGKPKAELANTSDFCYDTKDKSTLVVTASEGLSPYKYSLDGKPDQDSNIFKDVEPGTHNILVTDANGCTADLITNIVIAEQVKAYPEITKLLDCTSSPEAEITIHASLGYPTYKYQVSTDGGNNFADMDSNVYKADKVGSYIFKVTDSKGCSIVTSAANVNAKLTPTASIVSQTDPKCNNESTGQFTVQAAGGSGPTYEYKFNGGNYGASATYSNLNAFVGAVNTRTYTYQVKDSKGCESPVYEVTLTNPTKVSVSGSFQANTTCSTTTVITIVGDGGTGTYQYNFDGGSNYNGTTTKTITLTNAEQPIKFYVKDSNGCTAEGEVKVPAFNPPTRIDISNPAAITCNVGGTTTSLTLTAVNGIAPFTYEVTSGPVTPTAITGNTATFTGLTAGFYEFKVTDARGCTTTGSKTIAQGVKIKAEGSKTDEKCFEAKNGSVSFTVSDVSSPANFDYTITPNSGTPSVSGNTITRTNLAPGKYTFVATDRTTGCVSESVEVTVGAATAIDFTVDATKISCNNTVATLTISNISGGKGTYTYAFVRKDATAPTTYGTSLTVDTALLTTNIDVYVKDVNNCAVKKSISILTEDAPIINPIAAQCYPGSPIAVTIDGTFARPATFSKDGNKFESSDTFNLTPGTYKLTVKDKFGCEAFINYVVPEQLTITPAIVPDATCTTETTISLSSTGGTGTRSYAVSTDGGNIYTDITSPYTATAAGTYKFRVSDSANPTCYAYTADIPVTLKATTLTLNTSKNDVTCFNGSTGSILVTPTSGKAPYTYTITKNGVAVATTVSATTTTASAINLSAGTYEIVIKDGIECEGTKQVEITQPTELIADATIDPFTCNSLNTIESKDVTITASGGTLPYSYSFNGGSYSLTENTFEVSSSTSLQTVDYSVKDANGCEVTKTLTIQPLVLIEIDKVDVTPIYCNPVGSQTSTATITLVNNGITATSYSITSGQTNTTGATTGVFTGLAAGNYTFRATSANGCYDDFFINIPPLARMTATADKLNDVYCLTTPKESTGSIRYSVGGFTGSYSYSVNGVATASNQTANTFTLSNLGVGTYVVDFTDDTTLCTVSTSITINEPTNPLNLILDSNVNANCQKVNSKVTVHATGGTPNYKYAFVPSSPSTPADADFKQAATADLDPATKDWDVWVKDSNNCTFKLDIEVEAETTPVVSATVENQCDVSGNAFIIKASTTGGVTPYTYTINTGVAPNPGDTFTVGAGTYTITVKDANGCPATTTVTVYDALTVDAKLTKELTCPAFGTTDGNIKVSVVSGGRADFSYKVKVNGGLYSAGTDFTGTFFDYPVSTAGQYQFEITDENNCHKETVVVDVLDPEEVKVTETIVNPTCSYDRDGSVRLEVTAGEGPFTYNFNNTGFGDKFFFGGLAAGPYPYVVRDSKGCEVTGTANVVAPDPIVLFTFAHGITCNSTQPGSLDVRLEPSSGGTAPFTFYLYDNAMNVKDTHVAATRADALTLHNFPNLDFGDYFVTVVDANGCKIETTAVRIEPLPYLAFDAETVGADCVLGISVKLKVTGGTAPYVYSIYGIGMASPSTTDTEYTFNGLEQNTTYNFMVVDQFGCPSYYKYTTDKISDISAAVTPKDVTCFNAGNGELSFTVSSIGAGVTALNYEVRDNVTNLPLASPKSGTIAVTDTTVPYTANITGLVPGNYIIYVKEVGGTKCSTTAPFQIKQPASELKASVINVVPANCNKGAFVTVRANGGTGPYTYGFFDPATATAPASFGDDNVLEIPFTATTWTIVVKDSKDCTATVNQIISRDSSPVIGLSVANKCVAQDNFEIVVALTTAGVGPYSIKVDDGVFAPYTGTFPATLTGFHSGSHEITIKDKNNCTDTKTILIDEPLKVTPTPTVLPDCGMSNGAISFTAVGGSGNYSINVTPPNPNIVYGTNTVTGLLEDTDYTITMTDNINTGCSTTAQFRLEKGTDVTFDAEVTPVLCRGDASGTITVNLLPGNDDPNYIYDIALVSGLPLPVGVTQNGNVFSNLPQGDYRITVTSGRKCVASHDYTVNQPTVDLSVDHTLVDFGCTSGNNPNEASVTVQGAGGTTTSTIPYKYNFDGGSTYYELNKVIIPNDGNPHTINYYVIDANGCKANGSVTVPAFIKLDDINFSISAEPTCPAEESEVTLTAVGGYAIDKYEIISPITRDNFASNVFANLTAGTYMFRITDVRGCSIERPYKVESLTKINILKSSSINVSCNSANGTDDNGQATFKVSNFSSTGNYSINVTSTPPLLNHNISRGLDDVITLTDLEEGTYTVTVRDLKTQCEKSADVTITMPAPIDFTINTTKVFCSQPDSQITVSGITGGTANYTYAVANTNAVVPAASEFHDITVPFTAHTNLTDLTWYVYVRDSKGCTSLVKSTTITYDAPPVLNKPAQECFVGTDITIDFSNAALSTTYNNIKKFTVDGLPTTNNITFTKAGSYKIVLTDDNGCPAEIDYVIEERLTASATVEKDLYCEVGNEAAKIVVEVKGGKKDYTYQMYLDGSAVGLPKPATGDFEELVTAPGVYTFAISDSNVPCIFTTSPVTVNVPGTITLTPSQTDVICFSNSNGSLTVVPSGGVAPYKFVLTSTGTGANTTGDTTGIYTDLIQGDYHVVATDAKGCTAAADITIIQPPLLEEDHSVTPNSSCSTTTEIVVTGIGGKGTYQYDFGKGYDDADRISVPNDGSVASVTYTVRDENGCETAPVTVPIVPLNKPSALTFLPTAITCASGSSDVTVTATNGVGALEFRIIEFNGAPTTTYAMIPTTGSADPAVFTGLPFGEYKFEVTDSNKCTFADILTIKDVVRIQATGEAFAKSCIGTNDGKAVFTISDFKGTYTYTITKDTDAPSAPVTTSNSEVTLANLATGTYEISVIDDITNCDIKFSVTVNNPIAVTITEEDNINANCNTGAKVTVAGHGGTPGYTYSFVPASPTATPGTFEPEATRELKPADATSWYVYAKDQNGCISAPITVDIETDPLPAGFTASVTSQCPDADGNYEIVITPGTGMGPFTYSIGNGFQADEKFTVKDAKIYDIVVRDRFGCETQFPALIEILQPVNLGVIKDIQPSCADGDGQVTATATGGTGNFSYTLDGVRTLTTTPAVFDRVGSGPHTIVVTDLGTPNNCTDEVQFELDPATIVTGFDAVATPVTCHDGSDGTITASMAPRSTGVNDNPPYKYSINGGPLQDSPVFTGLREGTYLVDVISSRNCPAQVSVYVGQPDLIVVPDPTVVQYGCTSENNSNGATITVTGVTGGSETYPNYEFIRNGVVLYKGPRNVFTETDLLGGNYVVNVYDENNCVGTVVVTQPVNPYINLDNVAIRVTEDITCNNAEDIVVEVVTTPAVNPVLDFAITDADGNAVAGNPSNQTGIFVDLPIGNYIVTVTNPATGCTVRTVHYVNNPNTFEIKAVATNKKICFGTSDGSVELTFIDNQPTPSNEAGIFDYTITSSNGYSLPLTRSSNAGPVVISNLRAGEYHVTATLVGKPYCTVTTMFTIVQPVNALAVTAIKSDITCVSGNGDGAIYATATGGWDNDYEYQLYNNDTNSIVADFSTKFEFTALTEGNYTVTVRDGGNCTSTTTIQLRNPDPIQFTAAADSPMLLCYDDDGGIIIASQPTGGQGSNYMYTLKVVSDNPVSIIGPTSDPVFTGLRAGRYTVTVTDGYSCEAVSNEIVIEEPTLVKATLAVTRQQTCTTLTQLTISAVGGTPPYTYSVDGFSNLGQFNSSISFDVPVGVYSYYVKDANGCTSYLTEERNVEPLEPLNLKIDVSAAVVKCKDDETASIYADAIGGLGNYVYSLLNNSGTVIRGDQANGTFENLPDGVYRVKVVSGDCDYTSDDVTIKEPDTPFQARIETKDATCFGSSNGELEIIASGGTGKIQYAISPELDRYDSINIFKNLAPGPYTAVATDENGCHEIFEFVINQPTVLKATELVDSMIPESCSGEKDGVLFIEVVDGSGTAPYKASIDNEEGPFVDPDIDPLTFSFTGLAGGQHTIYIKDANDCIISFVSNSMPVPVKLDPKIGVDYDCENDLPVNAITVTVDSTFPEARKGEIVYTLISGGNTVKVQTGDNIFRNLVSGDYSVRASIDDCEKESNTVHVDQVDPLNLIDVTDQTTDINTITVKASGGVAPYEYSFNGEAFSSSNTYRIYKSGIYQVIVRDKNGCTFEIPVEGTFYDFCLPNYFTPNGGNGNTTIGPDCGALAYKDLTFDVYDRYGRVVGKYKVGGKWDGRYNGNELPTGDYWYVLKLNDPKDPREFVGHFTLYR